MLSPFVLRAKEFLQITWNEPRDRALHLLIFFFSVAGIVLGLQTWAPFELPMLVRMFSLQAALIVMISFLFWKGVRFRFSWHVSSLALTLVAYLAILFTLDYFAQGASPVVAQKWAAPRWEDALLSLVLAPVFEELFFRDYLMRSLAERGEKIWSAVLISTIFFTLAHFSLYPGAFLLGLAASFLYLWSGSLLAPIFLHFLCNLSWYLLGPFFPNILSFMESHSFRDWFYR
jgi:membrane protease YdiL (CAAX protease family)